MRRCLRKEQVWFGEGQYSFDEYAALSSTCRASQRFQRQEQPSEHIELVAYPVELVVKETAGGYNFSLSHRADEPKVLPEMGSAHAFGGS